MSGVPIFKRYKATHQVLGNTNMRATGRDSAFFLYVYLVIVSSVCLPDVEIHRPREMHVAGQAQVRAL